jgi:tetratricopeptide (TPR) repeat protein
VTQSTSNGRKLSVAIITRDAEATLAAALESVRAIADEIVVVDTGSTDRTKEIAQRGASRLVHFAWCDDFSAARNFALTQLTGDWVLWLDASEQLAAEAAGAIRTHIDSQPAARAAYRLMVQLPPAPGQTEGEQTARIRLWPLATRLKFKGRVREELIPIAPSTALAYELTDWRIQRSARDVLPEIKAAKARRDLRLAEMEINEKGPRPQLLIAMAEAQLTLGEPLKAAGWFRQAIDSSLPNSTERLEAYYGLLTTFDSRPAARDEQVATCLTALKEFPLDAQLLCAMGSYLQAQGRLDLACRSYQVAVEHGQINQAAWHLTNLPDVATICYSLTLELQGRTEDACQVLKARLQLRGNSDRLRQQLIDLHIKRNRRQQALAEVDVWPGEISNRDALRTAVRGACLAAQQQWAAAIPYLRRAYDSGCRNPICLRWLASAFIAVGELDAAEPILTQWQANTPGNPEPHRLLATLAQAAAERANREAPATGSSPIPWRVDASMEKTRATSLNHLAAGVHQNADLLTPQ